MPDPLYILTAIAAIGLAAWALLALLRPEDPAPPMQPAQQGASAGPGPSVAARELSPPAAPPAASAEGKADTSAPRIQAASADAPPRPLSPPTPTDTLLTTGAPDPLEDEPTGPNSLILVTAVGRTDPGLRRSHNEDAYAILEDHKLFVIADGMGKHAAGEVASQLCVESITEAFRSGKVAEFPAADPPLPHRAARLRSAILTANRKVLNTSQDNEAYHGMGTTVVSAYFSPSNQRAYIAHIGDSRCYRLRKDQLEQLTTDHTLGAAGITGRSAALLSRAVGIEENVDVDMLIEAPQPGDIYLLCSDGLSKMVNDDLIKSTLTDVRDLEEVTRVLIAKANEQGGRDNITTILVRVDTPPGPA